MSIDSRLLSPGALFVGLRGERADGGTHAAEALAAGAWGVLVAPEHARAAARDGGGGVVLAHPDPLAAMQALVQEGPEQFKLVPDAFKKRRLAHTTTREQM